MFIVCPIFENRKFNLKIPIFMKVQIILNSSDKMSAVKIDKGELVSFIKDNEELIHQKGSPGWNRSEIEMFPIIGPTSKNNNKVSTLKGEGVQDQHGLLRELKYNFVESSETKAVFEKTYKAGTKIRNDKFPDKSNNEFVFWPFDFSFKKYFELENDSLKITFEINSEKGMPFMLGFHPAFKLSGKGDEIIEVIDQKVTIDEVIKKGGNAFPFFDVEQVNLIKKVGQNINFKTEGFNNIMFWTQVKNMVCLEPITQYPDLESQSYSEKNMRISKGIEVFSVEISTF